MSSTVDVQKHDGETSSPLKITSDHHQLEQQRSSHIISNHESVSFFVQNSMFEPNAPYSKFLDEASCKFHSQSQFYSHRYLHNHNRQHRFQNGQTASSFLSFHARALHFRKPRRKVRFFHLVIRSSSSDMDPSNPDDTLNIAYRKNKSSKTNISNGISDNENELDNIKNVGPSSQSYYQVNASLSSAKVSTIAKVRPRTLEKKFSPLRRKVVELFNQAKAYERKNDWETARKVLAECLRLDYYDAHSWLAMAQLQARQSALTDDPKASQQIARNTFKKALDLFPDNIRIIQACAVYEQRCGNVNVARKFFSRGLQMEPSNPYIAQAWGLLEQRVGNVADARKIYAKCIDLRPQIEVCCAYGILEARQGNMTKARELFDMGILSFKGNYQSSRNGFDSNGPTSIYQNQDSDTLASQELQSAKLIRKSGGVIGVFKTWIELEDRMGEHDRARQLCKRAISWADRLDPIDAGIAKALLMLSWAKIEAERGGLTRSSYRDNRVNQSQDKARISSVKKVIEDIRMAAWAYLGNKPPAPVSNGWAILESDIGNLDVALKILQDAHRAYPQDSGILQTYAKIEQQKGNFEKALDLYQMSYALSPAAHRLVPIALLKEMQGDITGAREYFEKALIIDPTHSPAYNAYGMMEARNNNLEAARSVYRRGISINVAGASLFQGYGQFELRFAHDYQRARDLFIMGTRNSRDDNSFLWHSWGMLELCELENPLMARRVFMSALKLYPQNSRLLVGAALAFSNMKVGAKPDNMRARVLFRKAVLADVNHAHAWQTWAVFEIRQGNTDTGRELFKQGLQYCPNHGALWQAFAVLEMMQGNYSKSRMLFERGISACSKHVHLLQAWACMEVRCGNYERARQLLDTALEIDSSHGAVWNAYGLLESKYGTLTDAREKFMNGVSRAQNHAPLYRTYAQTEMRFGNYAKARAIFREGLRRAPRHAPLHHAYAEFEAMFGNTVALAELRKLSIKYFGSEEPLDRKSENSLWEPLYEYEQQEYFDNKASKSSMEQALDFESGKGTTGDQLNPSDNLSL